MFRAAYAVYAGLLIAMGVVLVQRFVRTRDRAYILFIVAIPLWPIVTLPVPTLIRGQIDRAVEGGFSFPLSLLGGTVGEVAASLQLIDGIVRLSLLLLGFLLLNRIRKSTPESTPNPAPHPSARTVG
jgi:hypothetical protein